MGHKSIKQTQHYAKVLAIKVTEDMDLLKKKLQKDNFISEHQISTACDLKKVDLF